MGKVSSLIIWEQSTFFAALFMGMMFAFIYDCIRVFRRVFKHKHVYTMAVEDILFWFYVSIRVFTCLYERNNGIIRGFIVISQIFGALIYRYAFGKLFVKYVTGLLIFILKPLKKVHELDAHVKSRRASGEKRKKCSLNPDGKNSSV